MSAELYDDFTGVAGPLSGRVAPTGQVWADANGDANGTPTLVLSGDGYVNSTATSNPPGAYGDIHLSAPVTQMRAIVSWTGSSASITENGAITLICSNNPARSGSSPAIGIYVDAIHVVVGLWMTVVTVYQGGVASGTLLAYTYAGGPLVADGRDYTVKTIYDGDRLIIDMPDGVRKAVVDERFKTLVGQHLIYQIYRTTSPNLYPRFNYVEANTSARAMGNAYGLLYP